MRGPEYLNFGILNPLILKIMPGKQYQTATAKSIPAWVLHFMGQTEAGMQTMLIRIPDHVSLESIEAIMNHLHFDVETDGFYGAYWACAGG